FVNHYLNHATPVASYEPPPPAPTSTPARVGFLDRLRGVASMLVPARLGAASSLSHGSWVTPRIATAPRLPIRGSRHTFQTTPPSTPTDDAAANRPSSLMWSAVVEKVLPAGGWTAAKNAGSLCDDFLVYVAGKTAEAIDGKSPAGIAAAKD